MHTEPRLVDERADRAAGMESASVRGQMGVRRFAVDRPVGVGRTGEGARHGIEEHLGVGMLRVGDEPLGGPDLDDLAEVHHGDRVAEVADNRHVVADEQHRESERRTDLAKHVEDRALHGDIE